MKYRKIFTCSLLAICLLLSPVTTFATSFVSPIETNVSENELPNLKLNCKSAFLIEQTTGQVLYEKNPDEKLPIASVTKIMTLLLTMDALKDQRISLEDKVPISEYAASMGGSQVFLEPGEEITLHEILKAVFVSSANDGAVALAELIGGSVEGFVAEMNEKASKLGMHNTIFYNPTGLDDEETNLSCAKDVALMSKALLAYEEIYPYTTTWIDSIRNGAFGLSNTNKMIRFYPGATGLKTGSTAKAKYCISSSAERNGLKLCAVVLAGETSNDRFQAAKTLLDYGFANYAYYQPNPLEFSNIPVWGGKQNQVSVSVREGGILLPKADAAGLESRVQIASELNAPVEKNQVVGSVQYHKNGKVVFESPIFTQESVEALSRKDIFLRLIRCFFTGSET